MSPLNRDGVPLIAETHRSEVCPGVAPYRCAALPPQIHRPVLEDLVGAGACRRRPAVTRRRRCPASRTASTAWTWSQCPWVAPPGRPRGPGTDRAAVVLVGRVDRAATGPSRRADYIDVVVDRPTTTRLDLDMVPRSDHGGPTMATGRISRGFHPYLDLAHVSWEADLVDIGGTGYRPRRLGDMPERWRTG